MPDKPIDQPSAQPIDQPSALPADHPIPLPADGSGAWAALRARALGLLRAGELLILPAEGLYGLHAAGEVGRRGLLAAKGERTGKPFIVLIAEPGRVGEYAPDLPRDLVEWIGSVWPAPLTLVLPAAPHLPETLVREGQIALRCPDSPWLRSLAAGCADPLLSTSANRAGGAPPAAVGDLDPGVRRAAALLVDAGRLTGQGSTVARLTRDGRWTVLREGLWRGGGPGGFGPAG